MPKVFKLFAGVAWLICAAFIVTEVIPPLSPRIVSAMLFILIGYLYLDEAVKMR